MRSLIWAFASRLNILWLLSYWLNIIWSFKPKMEAAQAHQSLHLSECQIVGNLMSQLKFFTHLFFRLFHWRLTRYFRILAGTVTWPPTGSLNHWICISMRQLEGPTNRNFSLQRRLIITNLRTFIFDSFCKRTRWSVVWKFIVRFTRDILFVSRRVERCRLWRLWRLILVISHVNYWKIWPLSCRCPANL